MRRRRTGATASERYAAAFLREHASLRRYVLLELEQNGPMLSRDLRDHSRAKRGERHPWWGARNVSLLLEILSGRGVVAVAGRERGHRLWDLAERCYPDVEKVPLRAAERALAEQRFRAQGVRLTRNGWEAHPEASAEPVAPQQLPKASARPRFREGPKSRVAHVVLHRAFPSFDAIAARGFPIVPTPEVEQMIMIRGAVKKVEVFNREPESK
jgi:hypothetical protein